MGSQELLWNEEEKTAKRETEKKERQEKKKREAKTKRREPQQHKNLEKTKIPEGWTRKNWIERLEYLKSIQNDPKDAKRYEEWAKTLKKGQNA